MSSIISQALSMNDLGTSAYTSPQEAEDTPLESAPLWVIQLECKKPYTFTGVPCQSLPSLNFLPLTCTQPNLEVIFPHPFDPLGRVPGWLEHYGFSVSSPIVHICDENLRIGVIDLSQTLGITDEIGVLKFVDIICFLSFFMGSNLSRDIYFSLDKVTRAFVSLTFRRRMIGPLAKAGGPSEDWDAFVNNGRAIRHPRNSDLFLGRRNVWKFSVLPGYSILWVSGELLFGPEV
ncbi:hypothetical protein P691DRAFT_759083 [Macrolepiota fuliginosa MF-IS2]|uniref:Uncharacterized protein n=1 Tax=Macrolepiota fuliginosa MF-IS2 TaxID=1400762 RepID=A0A9P5XHP4_9AGAR|nr:hypothetical protein P691DRAFT_759083 [Macrolepiota fuliginosa MF-IS2]